MEHQTQHGLPSYWQSVENLSQGGGQSHGLPRRQSAGLPKGLGLSVGVPKGGRSSEPKSEWQAFEKYNKAHDTEKPSPAPATKTSKWFLLRLLGLGTCLVLTIAALVLTLVILVVGRHGDAGSDLALLTIDMSNFARFNPQNITLVQNTTEATKARRDFDSWTSGIASAAGSAESSAETWAAGAASAVGSAATAVETAVAGAVASAEAEADKIIDEIGDTLEDIETAVEGLMEKVMGTIQDELNKWLQEASNSLNDLDIPGKMTLHLTTSCSSPRSTASNSTQLETTCSQIFTSGATTFNSTENNGTILGFQPGNVVSQVMGLFFVPASALSSMREPIDNATNTVQKLMDEAGSEVSSWSVNLLFLPIVAVYILAAVFTSLLLLLLVAIMALSILGGESVPASIYSLCGMVAGVAAFFLFLGSVILTAIAMAAYIIGLGGGVVNITVTSGSTLKWMSWGSFIIMAFVTVVLKVEEYVAICMAWWNFFKGLLRLVTKRGSVKEAFAASSKH